LSDCIGKGIKILEDIPGYWKLIILPAVLGCIATEVRHAFSPYATVCVGYALGHVLSLSKTPRRGSHIKSSGYRDSGVQLGRLGRTKADSTARPDSGDCGGIAVEHESQQRRAQNKNDVASSLEIQGMGFGGPGAWGAPYFNVQDYSPIGDS
jgi:hypothetical protein